jgi:hypothetical protein
LLLLFLLIRLPYLSSPQPLLSTELECMLVGEKLNQGLHLYNEILTQIGPLSALVYQLVDLWVGKNQFVYETIALFLIFIQTLYFVFVVNKRNLLNEKNYVSGLFFLLLMSVSYDIQKLSPALLANTFILIALNVTLRQIEKRDGVGDDVFEIGLFLGIATLFQLSSFIFIFWAILVLFLYTSVNIRQLFMVVLAFILTLFLVYIFFHFKDQGQDYLNTWMLNINNIISFSLLGIRDILISYTLPTVIAVFGMIKVLRVPRYNGFQNRAHQILIIFGIFSFVSLFFSGDFIPSNLISFIPFLAFFVSGFFVHSKKTLIPEFLTLVFIVLVLGIQYIGSNKIGLDRFDVLKKYEVSETKLPAKYDSKKIYITGPHIDAYKTHEMATGYLSWKLAKSDFQNPNNYISVINIYNNFKKDMPEVIIDKEEVMAKVFKNIPTLAERYKQSEENIYELKK